MQASWSAEHTDSERIGCRIYGRKPGCRQMGWLASGLSPGLHVCHCLSVALWIGAQASVCSDNQDRVHLAVPMSKPSGLFSCLLALLKALQWPLMILRVKSQLVTQST